MLPLITTTPYKSRLFCVVVMLVVFFCSGLVAQTFQYFGSLPPSCRETQRRRSSRCLPFIYLFSQVHTIVKILYTPLYYSSHSISATILNCLRSSLNSAPALPVNFRNFFPAVVPQPAYLCSVYIVHTNCIVIWIEYMQFARIADHAKVHALRKAKYLQNVLRKTIAIIIN